MARVHLIVAYAVAGLLAAGAAHAVTPTQNAVDAARAKAEQIARLKVQTEAKTRQDSLARTKAAEQAQAKAQAIGAQSVFEENKRRLAAALAASAVQERVREAHASISKDGASSNGSKIAGQIVRRTRAQPGRARTADARARRLTHK